MPPATQRDYYQVLGVTRDADQKTIRDAFRQLALRYHPDRSKEADAEERFKEIAEAYAILSSPEKREQYDRRGFAGVAGFSAEDLFGGIDFGEIFGGAGFDLGGFGGGLFDPFGRSRRRGPMPGADVRARISVPLERIVEGGEETVRFTHPRACDACGGSGAKAGTTARACAECDGTGKKVLSKKEERRKGGSFVLQQITDCPTCGGTGQVIDQPCAGCGGTGRTAAEQTLTVKIPVGADEGLALRVPGHGLPSDAPGGAPGDLYVIVHTLPDPRFERAGADLWRIERIGIADAALGTEIEVPTLSGVVEVTVPPGTQPDAVLRLRGKGLPVFGGRGVGDLNLRIAVEVPRKLSRAERTLYERLRALRGGPE